MIELDRRHDTLGLPGLRNQLVDRGTDLLDLGVAKFNGIDHRILTHTSAAALDHHHAIFGGHDGDVQRALEPLGIGRIDDELTIHLAHTHRADRAAERNVGKRQGRSSGIDADHVGIVLFVRGHDQGNHLGLIAEILGEHGANGAVDLAAGKNLTLAGTALALDKAAGNAAASIGVLAVIHGQGEKIESFFGIWCGYGGRQNYVVTLGHEHGARGLLGHPACFKSQSLATGKLDSHFLFHKILISYVHIGRGNWRPRRRESYRRERQNAERGLGDECFFAPRSQPTTTDQPTCAFQPVQPRVHQPSQRSVRSSLFA